MTNPVPQGTPTVAASSLSGCYVAFTPVLIGGPHPIFALMPPATVAHATSPTEVAANAVPPASVVPAPVAPTAPPSAPRTAPSAGVPAALQALLRTDGPFLANEVFSVTPAEPLGPIDEPVPAPEWYAITRGRFVGVVDQFALSAVAISGVAHSARKAYATQNLALDAFNRALTWGGVQVA